ncbi:MAG TPA: exodeoxyribonuclease III [Solirubrobacteraceae bacterium]|nr:exodeoxyribonuclease III [Solirubrobacteraceae bacterium]
MIEGMRVMSWNVNGIRARWARLSELLTCERPDVVCLQETRCTEARFPHEHLLELGYRARHSAGRDRSGGVAILVREDHRIEERRADLHKRRDIAEGHWLELETEGIAIGSVYVPAGAECDAAGDSGKLAFLEAVARHAYEAQSRPLLIAGDFNVAPTDQDVYEPSWFQGSYHTGAAERADLRAILDEGELVDVYRRLHPDASGFTCWDQREGHYGRDYGLRIDLVLASEGLAPYIDGCEVNHVYRRGYRPSDHAPLDVELHDVVGAARCMAEREPALFYDEAEVLGEGRPATRHEQKRVLLAA